MAKKINGEVENSDLKEVTVAPDAFDSDMYKTNDIALDQIQGKIPYPEIQMDDIDFNNYDLILVGSPVWSGYPATPIKPLLEKMKTTVVKLHHSLPQQELTIRLMSVTLKNGLKV